MIKRKGYQFWVPLAVIVAVVGALGAGLSIAVQPIDNASSCKTIGKTYTMTVGKDKITPENIDAKHCDKLTIVNGDSVDHLIMFGHHDDMLPYDGITQKPLSKDQSFTVTLAQAGSFHFHDDETELIGTFSVQ